MQSAAVGKPGCVPADESAGQQIPDRADGGRILDDLGGSLQDPSSGDPLEAVLDAADDVVEPVV